MSSTTRKSKRNNAIVSLADALALPKPTKIRTICVMVSQDYGSTVEVEYNLTDNEIKNLESPFRKFDLYVR